MFKHRITRREALKAGALATLPLVAASPAPAGDDPKHQARVTIGIATTQFGEYTNSQLAEELAQQGLHTVQLFLTQSDSRYWKYNDRSDLSDLTAAR